MTGAHRLLAALKALLATKVTFCVRGVISPLLSNLYLNEVDRMLERAKETTRFGKYTCIEYARFADDLVILIDAHPRHDWLMGAVEKRLREEFADLQVEINEEKSRIVDLGRGESFGFLGFDFCRIRSRRGAWRANYTPKLKKRTALLRKLKDVIRRYQSCERRSKSAFFWPAYGSCQRLAAVGGLSQ